MKLNIPSKAVSKKVWEPIQKNYWQQLTLDVLQ